MKDKSYYEKREINCTERSAEIIKTLPYYVSDFFIGVEPRTSALTRLNYAYDLRIFFDFLSKKVFRSIKPEQIELSDLDKLMPADFEYFLSNLSHYEINGKNERCTESGKARKLSTLRAFFKYFFSLSERKNPVGLIGDVLRYFRSRGNRLLRSPSGTRDRCRLAAESDTFFERFAFRKTYRKSAA